MDQMCSNYGHIILIYPFVRLVCTYIWANNLFRLNNAGTRITNLINQNK